MDAEKPRLVAIVSNMLRGLVKRYGVVRSVLILTLSSILVSELVTQGFNLITENRLSLSGALVALVVPLIVAPIFSGVQVQSIHQLEQAREAMHRLSITDELTQIYNRRYFMEVARQAFTDRQKGMPFAVVLFDADDFKKVNDTYGHVVGDQVLRHIAEVTQASIRKGDVLARYGGEEFIVLLPQTDQAQALEVAERIQQAILFNPAYSAGEPLKVTVSMGVATCQPYMQDPDDLLIAADDALYRAKNLGKNRIEQSRATLS